MKLQLDYSSDCRDSIVTLALVLVMNDFSVFLAQELAVQSDLWFAEKARLTFVVIYVRFLAFEGVTRLSVRHF